MALPMLAQIISSVDNIGAFPIQAQQIIDKIIEFGVQDRVIVCKDNEMNTDFLRGLFYRYRSRDAVYGEPAFVSLVIYPGKVDINNQRMIVAKELVHVFDSKEEMTDTIEELDALADRVLGPLATDDVGIGDLMALKDKIAFYQAIPLLLPPKMLCRAKDVGWDANRLSKEAVVPIHVATLAMTNDWPKLVSYFLVTAANTPSTGG